MGRTMRKMLPMAVLSVCAVIVGAVAAIAIREAGASRPDRRLAALARLDAPLPETERGKQQIDPIRLAEEDPDFRDWLVGMATSDERDM